MSQWQEISGNSGSKVVAHVGGIARKREELRLCQTPAATRTWRPVPHYDLITTLINNLESRGVTVGTDGYATYKNDLGLLGFMDLNVPGITTDDYTLALGISTANDKSRSIRLIVGARVFVCDNQAFSGGHDAVYLNRKHTANLDLGAEIPVAVDRFLINSAGFPKLIEAMKGENVTDTQAKALIYDAVRAKVVPQRLLDTVGALYFDDETQRDKFPERTLWSVNNAFTEAAKILATTGRQSIVAKTACENRVGAFFANIARGKLTPSSTVLDGVDFIDGGGYNPDIKDVGRFDPDAAEANADELILI